MSLTRGNRRSACSWRSQERVLQWVFTLGGWSPDQFKDDKKPFTRDELDKYLPNNPVLLQFTRAETYLNSKAIEAIGLEKRTEPWIYRDASGRATGIVENAGAGAVRNAAGFLKVEVSKAQFEASQMQMLKDLAPPGLTASAVLRFRGHLQGVGQEGRSACDSSVSVRRKGRRLKSVREHPETAIPRRRMSGLTNSNWGEGWQAAVAATSSRDHSPTVPQSRGTNGAVGARGGTRARPDPDSHGDQPQVEGHLREVEKSRRTSTSGRCAGRSCPWKASTRTRLSDEALNRPCRPPARDVQAGSSIARTATSHLRGRRCARSKTAASCVGLGTTRMK